MTSLQMALLHFKRQKLQSFLIVVSLAIALAFSCLLLRIYSLSQDRYKNLPSNIDAIVGPKSGGIEILLGSLNMEKKFHGVIPENVFQTLREGADIRFEDNALISSKNITQSVIPITFIGSFNNHPVIATDESFFSELRSQPSTNEVWIGSQVSKELNLKVNDTIKVEISGTISKKSIQKTLSVGKVLDEKRNSWDGALFVSNSNKDLWLTETEAFHPVWKNKILNYILFKMNSQGFIPLQSLINDRTVSQLIWVDSEKQKLDELTNSAKDLGVIFVVVIFALAGFSIFGMMSLRAQTLRISVATLEAIGYLPQYVYSWIFYESLLVGVFAAAIGIFLEVLCFQFVKSSLDTTWLIPLFQSSDLNWSVLIILEGLLFVILGSALSVWQMKDIQIHTELKSG